MEGSIVERERHIHALTTLLCAAVRFHALPYIATHCHIPLPYTMPYTLPYTLPYLAHTLFRHIVHLFEWPLLRLLQDSLQEQWRSYLAIGMRTEQFNWSHLTVSDTWVHREKKWHQPIWGYFTFATKFHTCRTMQPGNPKKLMRFCQYTSSMFVILSLIASC